MALTLYDLYTNNKDSSFSCVFYDFKSKHQLSYKQNHLHICEISELLNSVSVAPSVIGCLISPGLYLPSVILGILRVHCSFVFLDVQKPCASLNNIQKYVPIKIILVEEPFLKVVKEDLCNCWHEEDKIVLGDFSIIFLQSLDCHNDLCFNSRKIYPNVLKNVSKLAYVIQTSGTTGEPKIIQVPCQCIVPNVLDLKQKFNISSEDVLMLCSPLTFDPSIIEIFLAVSAGCTLVIVPNQLKSIPKKFIEVIINSKVTVLQATPTLIQSLGEDFIKDALLSESSSLRILAFGGEPCPSIDKIKRWKAKDNKTRIFNLYGLTEVSCWATCFEINLEKKYFLPSIPLGEPLLDTIIEITEGELSVGGEKRWCVINDEEWPNNDHRIMRKTGDYVIQISNNLLYFESRKDNVLKFKGRKLSLLRINTVVEGISRITNHYLNFDPESSKLLLFVVLDKKSSGEEHIRYEVLKKLQQSISGLPITEVITVPYIPLTKHGKADYNKLVALKNSRNQQRKLCAHTSNSAVLNILSDLWQSYTNQETVKDIDNFILSGGDSFMALQLTSDIEWEFQIQIPEITDKLLNYSFRDVYELIKSYMQDTHEKNIESQNTFVSDNVLPNESAPKKARLIGSECFEVVTRRGYSLICKHLKEKPCSSKVINNDLLNSEELSLKMKCKFDLKKCIDASPCVAHFFENNELLGFIGSHAGLFCCFNVLETSLKWTVKLPDRIESSSCLSFCGKYVFVGCYDHHLYCLNVKDGNILWLFSTGAEVKSSPVVSSQNSVFIGSHDKHIYAINGENGELLWKRMIGKGSIFSSPALFEDSGILSVATLDGILAVLKMDTGITVWTYNYGKPLFSSPLFTTSGIFIGATNNCFLHFNLSGTLVFEFCTNGPVFSSAIAALSPDNDHIIFGCHDSAVYCVNLKGEGVWKCDCDSPVYATPFVFQWKQNNYVAVATTAGMIYILSQRTGKIEYTLKCLGEIFSSPVILNGYLVVGCRDNFVYCYNLSSLN
ncbi:Beta-alanine-activating enzyme [Araneus ventricosus]|uniref:Beta-alanine-activating enzyme n=1 Tax=Araneus ventricosus TaxID=182803 RepID=A0A4Y2I575_ARAVE|nr:Beta-alanine-activating enzyme [Araneus ventricosus]